MAADSTECSVDGHFETAATRGSSAPQPLLESAAVTRAGKAVIGAGRGKNWVGGQEWGVERLLEGLDPVAMVCAGFLHSVSSPSPSFPPQTCAS